MPAYHFDPYQYKFHRMKGGNFQSFTGKTYLPFTDEQLVKHLTGEQLVGIYPLLKDNTSWFIAADFDENKWEHECRNLIAICTEWEIPAYFERSRSGKGGHVWIFFESPYPAIKSRAILTKLLEQTGIFSEFDKSSSFDRLFPNQDFLSGKGLGNLIALPLYKPAWEQGNSCFIETHTLEPHKDQWELIKSIKKVPTEKLNTLYQTLNSSSSHDSLLNIPVANSARKISIVLNSNIIISRNGLPLNLVNYLKEELNLPNPEFFIKKKSGRNTWETGRYFKLLEETIDSVIIPRGFTGRLLRFCKEYNIEHQFDDQRKRLDTVLFSTSFKLREYQKEAIEATAKKDFGVIVAPPGSGKTIIGLKIIAEKQQPSLIIVHRKQLADQWIERIKAFLGIPAHAIGKIGYGKSAPGKMITVAMIQSISKLLNTENASKIKDVFGTVIIDECHHIPAETYRNAISKLNSYYCYGLTATPFRKYDDGKLISLHLGEIISEIKLQNIDTVKKAQIIIKTTELDVPYNPRTDKFETLSKILVHDSARNNLILEDVSNELNTGRKVIIITERKEHIEVLHQYLKRSFEAITLSGEDSELARINKWKTLRAGNYQVLITTGQFFGEGSDLPDANCLFLVYPFSFRGKLIQYMGRVQRSEIAPIIYDYRDIKIDYLNRMFLKRNSYYRKFYRQAELFNDPLEDYRTPQKESRITEIQYKIKMPFEHLEFRYGAFAFRYNIPELNKEMEFEVDNDEIRPEFDVLKPYFIKYFKSKTVNIDLNAELQNDEILAQLATSEELEKINQEVIESVRFQFATKLFFGKTANINGLGGTLSLEQIQSNNNSAGLLYESEKDLLNEALKNGNIKHFKHLRYLSMKHESSILKLRFVLNPFSFVFLLAGEQCFHVVMETLDTEEATYIWHIQKDMEELKLLLNNIDEQLNIIRNKGRQAFLSAPPDNFSRIIHDYSDERKGFIIWKGLLEERLK